MAQCLYSSAVHYLESFSKYEALLDIILLWHLHVYVLNAAVPGLGTAVFL